MRIISGIYKGRIIQAPGNLPSRPTTDFAKTGLFNIINFRYKFEKLSVLDLFAGTGNITFEFASRHCLSVVAIDENFSCIKFIRKIIADLKMEHVAAVQCDAFEYAEKCSRQFDIIFADPPYELKNYSDLVHAVFENKLVSVGGIFILEHQSKKHFTDHKYFSEERKYGNAAFTFFTNESNN